MPARGDKPVIIKRVVVQGHGGHHGGAWKVAYADFVTAMMAFFLLLWLISSASEDTLKGLSEYFNDTKVQVGPPGGAGGFLEGRTLLPSGGVTSATSPPIFPPLPAPPDPASALDPADAGAAGALSDEALEAEHDRREEARFDEAREAIAAALEASPELRRYGDNLMVDRTPEGLRVQIVDLEESPMFPVGSDRMYPHTRRLLEVVARAVAGLPNRVSVRGHTDSLPFAPGAAYDNWSLSSDRADTTRRALVELGLAPARVADVTGKAYSDPLVPENPQDPRNRRISLVLLHDEAPAAAAGPPAAVPADPGAATVAPPSAPVGGGGGHG